MTTTVTESTRTAVAALPRVNLLPPEIGDAQRLRRLQVGLGAGVAVSAVAVGALAFLAAGQVSSAQDDLDASKSRGAQLQAETAKYDDVPLVYAQVDAKKAQLELAMGREVRWSYVLNDLSLKTPAKVWLTQMTVSETVDAAAPGVVAPATATPTLATPGIGTVTWSGKAYQHNDVASWLRAIGSQKGFADPYFTRSEEAPIGESKAVEFDSQAVITEEALSGRYVQKAGS